MIETIDIAEGTTVDWTDALGLFWCSDNHQLQFINVSDGSGFGDIQRYWERHTDFNTTFHIDGVGLLQSDNDYIPVDDDSEYEIDFAYELNHCTVIYYPLEDKMIAIKHKWRLA